MSGHPLICPSPTHKMLTLMHPFMPYVTEEIHHKMTKHSMDQTLLIHQPYPKPSPVNGQLHGLIQSLQQCISSVRTLEPIFCYHKPPN